VFLIGGGLAVKVGAGENSYRQVVLFSEILSLVMDNYVDPVESDELLKSAYEGLLGGLDANGAYLSPGEVEEWKAERSSTLAQPGMAVLKAGRAIQVVAVYPGSPADEAGITVGDQIRAIDENSVRDLSLGQSWRRLLGAPGTTVTLDLLHPSDGFRREQVVVQRKAVVAPAYRLSVEDRGTAVLTIRDMTRLESGELASELDDVRTRGVDRLLIDLRNVADLEPRAVGRVGGLFSDGTLLQLRDRSGDVVETLSGSTTSSGWAGSVAILVNGATAGSAEALASLMRSERGVPVLGESTYGLGAEAELYELENGAGLVVSSALWETASGTRWNGEGVEPDEVIRGEGPDYDTVISDQLQRALEWFENENTPANTKSAA
jgi:carboxyl-terminal processing protease